MTQFEVIPQMEETGLIYWINMFIKAEVWL